MLLLPNNLDFSHNKILSCICLQFLFVFACLFFGSSAQLVSKILDHSEYILQVSNVEIIEPPHNIFESLEFKYRLDLSTAQEQSTYSDEEIATALERIANVPLNYNTIRTLVPSDVPDVLRAGLYYNKFRYQQSNLNRILTVLGMCNNNYLYENDLIYFILEPFHGDITSHEFECLLPGKMKSVDLLGVIATDSAVNILRMLYLNEYKPALRHHLTKYTEKIFAVQIDRMLRTVQGNAAASLIIAQDKEYEIKIEDEYRRITEYLRAEYTEEYEDNVLLFMDNYSSEHFWCTYLSGALTIRDFIEEYGREYWLNIIGTDTEVRLIMDNIRNYSSICYERE